MYLVGGGGGRRGGGGRGYCDESIMAGTALEKQKT